MGVEVLCYGGVQDYDHGELGGVQILFKDEKTRFFLDFGQRPDHYNQYYGFPGKPPAYKSIAIAKRLQFYPDLDSVFREDYARNEGLTVSAEPPEIQIDTTHPHFDHVGGLHLVRHNIPVWMGPAAKRLLYLWQYTSGRTVNQFIDLYDAFTLVPGKDGRLTELSGEASMLRRKIHIYEHGESYMLGDVKATSFLVDHSTPGSYGKIYETSAGKIGVSGDIRCRGRHPEYTKNFEKALIEKDVDYLFMEGSLLHFDHFGTEDDVSEKVAELIHGRVVKAFACPPRDADRWMSMYLAAKREKVMLAVPPSVAVLLRSFDGDHGFPKLDWKYIGVLMPPKRKARIGRDFPAHLVEKDYYSWERSLLESREWDEHLSGFQKISLYDIRDNKDQFFTYMPFNSMINFLETIDPPLDPRSNIYLRSHPAPWTADMEIQESQKINILKVFGMYDGPKFDHLTPDIKRKMHQVHITGHFNRSEARGFIRRVHEATGCTIIPYHCMNPQDFTEDIANGMKVKVPERKERFMLG